ncbi:Protein MCM10 like protein [Argiope bruennichi]|uniref:Protein MCM10 homolog n=1 Tax=Argiope bruennichi TaxID=94029 RepID=A0A8T0E8L8_ARGBR|nr:Protein MCM10 like protein [Argiope bruennichi]
MDLDSLMELLDDDETFEEGTSVPQVTANTTENNSAVTKHIGIQPPQLKLKDMFQEDFLTPKIIENPKKDTSFNKPSLKMFPLKDSVVHTGETDSSDEESKEYLTKTGQNIKKTIEKKLSLSDLHSKPTTFSVSTWTDKNKSKNNANSIAKDNSFIVDSYSGIRIINPLVSFTTLQQRMDGRRMIKMSFIHNFIKNGDIEGDWVTMGVIIQKIPPKTSANGKTYSIWKMSDLHDVEKPVSVFLFKTAHTELWKTTVGTVIGILNPSIMPKKDNHNELCLAVDQPGKCMMMGKSKDLGFCKSKRKDGTPCNVAVNMFQCEYCTFHIKKEYRKFSSKRSELQSSFSGREPSLKNKVLKGQNVFYGGQSFTAAVEKKSSNKLKTKDKLTLSSLNLKRKAEALESVEKEKSAKKLSDIYGPDILKVAEKNSEFINEKLAIPTAGSRNLLHHLMKEKPKKEEQVVKVITPKEQLKLYQSRMNVNGPNKQKDQLILKNLMPQIGRGLHPGQEVPLDFISPKRSSPSDIAKLKAIQLIKKKGPLKNKDPNSTKVSEESADKVKVVLDRCLEEKKDGNQSKTEKSSIVTTQLGTLDMNSEKVKEILNRKSSHMYEVEMAEMEKEAAYFNALEKKERMEEKMASTLEIVCDVVSCRKCKYTAHSATEKCKSEQHPLKCHKAVKRFFACKDCKHRTFAFTKLPTHVCRVCKGSSFERTSMMKARKGPKLDTEILNIRGEEEKFLDSQCSIKF